MKLLLHICCAPCSTEVIRRLSSEYEVTGFFYNPNIHPKEEYELRLKELERFSKDCGFRFIDGKYDSEKWFKNIEGFESEPEGGERCKVCFRIRLERTAMEALKGGFDIFTTTLTISPHKNAQAVNTVGEGLEEMYGVAYLKSDFKKKDGFKKSIEHSKKHGLMRQNYCGCIYSKQEKSSHDA